MAHKSNQNTLKIIIIKKIYISVLLFLRKKYFEMLKFSRLKASFQGIRLKNILEMCLCKD